MICNDCNENKLGLSWAKLSTAGVELSCVNLESCVNHESCVLFKSNSQTNIQLYYMYGPNIGHIPATHRKRFMEGFG